MLEQSIWSLIRVTGLWTRFNEGLDAKIYKGVLNLIYSLRMELSKRLFFNTTTATCILSLSFSDWFGIKAAISNDVLELLSETFKLWSHCVYYFLFTIISYHCNIGVVKFDQFLILRRKNAVVANAILPKFQDSSQSCTYDLKIENVKAEFSHGIFWSWCSLLRSIITTLFSKKWKACHKNVFYFVAL